MSNNYDLKVEHIDFAWVDKTENVKTLKRGLQLLKDDGGF
jgi:glutaredoxin-related protein